MAHSRETKSPQRVPSGTILVHERNAVSYNNRLCLLLTVLCLASYAGNTEGLLTQVPTDATAILNHYPAYFNCSTSKRPVESNAVWRHYPLHGDRKYVFAEGQIHADYKDRFAIEISESSGEFNLVVWQPLTMDAGRYECTDDDNNNQGASAELLLLESNWDCTSNEDPEGLIGLTQCNEDLAPDELKLSCSVTCIGKGFPQIEWRINGNPMTQLDHTCTMNGSTLTCDATIKAVWQMEGSISICHTGTAHCSLARKVKVLYAFANVAKFEYYTGEEATCAANTSELLPCLYKWYNENKVVVSSNSTFKPTEAGLYRCKSVCRIRNHRCLLFPTVIIVTETGLNVILRIAMTLSFYAGLFAAVIILLWFVWSFIAKQKLSSDQSITSSDRQQNGSNLGNSDGSKPTVGKQNGSNRKSSGKVNQKKTKGRKK